MPRHERTPRLQPWGAVRLDPWTQLVVLMFLVALLAGGLGGLLATRWLRHGEAPLRVGVINFTRLTQAVAAAGLNDPRAGVAFGPRFEAAIQQLVEADPDRLLLVREAVVAGGHIEDLTDALLPLFAPAAGQTLAPPTSPPTVTED